MVKYGAAAGESRISRAGGGYAIVAAMIFGPEVTVEE